VDADTAEKVLDADTEEFPVDRDTEEEVLASEAAFDMAPLAEFLGKSLVSLRRQSWTEPWTKSLQWPSEPDASLAQPVKASRANAQSASINA
jgi:hypothetical protein